MPNLLRIGTICLAIFAIFVCIVCIDEATNNHFTTKKSASIIVISNIGDTIYYQNANYEISSKLNLINIEKPSGQSYFKTQINLDDISTLHIMNSQELSPYIKP